MTIQQIINYAFNNKEKYQQILVDLQDEKTICSEHFKGCYDHQDEHNLYLQALVFAQSEKVYLYFMHNLSDKNTDKWTVVKAFENLLKPSNNHKFTGMDLFREMTSEQRKVLATKYVYNKVQKEVRQSAPSANVAVKLDLFSFKIFEQHIAKLGKKGLSSAEAERYLDKLYNEKENQPIYVKYFNLIWENTPRKSIKFIQSMEFTANSSKMRRVDLKDRPVVVNPSNNTVQYTGTPSPHTDVMLTIGWYQQMIRTYSIPVSQYIMTNTHSDVYQWMTGTNKPSPLNASEIELTVDQIVVLNYMIIQDPTHKIYYQKVLDQLTEELAKKQYSGQGLKKLQARIAPLEGVTKTLKETYESLRVQSQPSENPNS